MCGMEAALCFFVIAKVTIKKRKTNYLGFHSEYSSERNEEEKRKTRIIIVKSFGFTFSIGIELIILRIKNKMAIKKIYIAILSVVLLAGCGEYNKILKSTDNDLKFSKAKEYYERGKYLNAATLLESVVTSYKGTEKGEEALHLLGMSYFKNEDNLTAKSYFAGYFRSYPRGKYAEECKFYVGKCYYLESPEPKLDQEFTKKAIDEFLSFVELYPNSQRMPEVMKMLGEMKDKLAYKAYLNAKLYHKLGNYQGNNYQSAVIAARNAIKEHPASKYEEELMFLILKSKFLEAEESVAAKQEERYRDTVDEYYSFANYYPESKYKKEALHIFEKSSKHLK